MKLHFRKLGEGKPLIILHGLFGSSDNWQTLGKQYAEYQSELYPKGFAVFLVDQRNHGHSPHSDKWDYSIMAEDILHLMDENNILNPIIIGHSMGGKTAMTFALNYPTYLEKIVVVDIGPKYYPTHHGEIIEALYSLDFNQLKSRKDAEQILSQQINDIGTRQFLLKNLYWKGEKMDWRFNLAVISENIESIGQATEKVNEATLCAVPTLFVRGAKSNYISDSDLKGIQKTFPNSQYKTVQGAGHWVHAEQPQLFFETTIGFFEEGIS